MGLSLSHLFRSRGTCKSQAVCVCWQFEPCPERRGEICGVRRQRHTLCGLGKNVVRWGEICLLTLKEKNVRGEAFKKKNESMRVGSFLQMTFCWKQWWLAFIYLLAELSNGINRGKLYNVLLSLTSISFTATLFFFFFFYYILLSPWYCSWWEPTFKAGNVFILV